MPPVKAVAVEAKTWINDDVLDMITFDDGVLLSAAVGKLPGLIRARDSYGQTLLHLAASRNAWRCVDALLAAGSDVHTVDLESRWTPLHAAVYRGSLLAAQRLLLHKGHARGPVDSEGYSPFELIQSRFNRHGDASMTIAGRTRHVLSTFGSATNLQLGFLSDASLQLQPKTPDNLTHGDIVQFDVCEIGGACVMAQGTVYTWGVNRNGRLGHGDDVSRIRPEPVTSLLSVMCVNVAVSLTHSVFLMSNGHVYTCGRGYLGHDGAGCAQGQQLSLVPRRVEKGLKRVVIVGISCSKYRTCLVSDAGYAYLLGYHMGDDGIDYWPTRIDLLANLHIVRMLTTNGHWIALTNDGILFEQARREPRFRRVPISRSTGHGPKSVVVDLSTCKSHCVAVTSDGNLYMWPSRAVKGGAPDPAVKPIAPRPVRTVRNVFVVNASTSIEHTAVITSQGDLIQWEHASPLNAPASDRFHVGTLGYINEKPSRLSKPKCIDAVRCAPGCTLVTQTFIVPTVAAPAPVACKKGGLNAIPSLFQMCERVVCTGIDERRVIAAFKFAQSYNSPLISDHCATFIAANAEALIAGTLRELDLHALTYLEERYRRLIVPGAVRCCARNGRPPIREAPSDNDRDLDWFVPQNPKHLRVKIRALSKKLTQITQLSERKSRGQPLNQEQLDKYSQRDGLRVLLQQCQGAMANWEESTERSVWDDEEDEHDDSGFQSAAVALPVEEAVVLRPPPSSVPSRTARAPAAAPPLLQKLPAGWSESPPAPASTATSTTSPPAKSPIKCAPEPWSTIRRQGKAKASPTIQSPSLAPKQSPSPPSPILVHAVPVAAAAVSKRDVADWPLLGATPPPAPSLSLSHSTPRAVKARSRAHATTAGSPIQASSPWACSPGQPLTPFSAILRETELVSSSDSARALVRAPSPALSPWGANRSSPLRSSPTILGQGRNLSFSSIVKEEEMSLKGKQPNGPVRPPTCWGPQLGQNVKPLPIESIQSMQFIEDTFDKGQENRQQSFVDPPPNPRRARAGGHRPRRTIVADATPFGPAKLSR